MVTYRGNSSTRKLAPGLGFAERRLKVCLKRGGDHWVAAALQTGRARQKALGPPPTNVGQLPQPSVTVISTVAGWPAFTRCTVSARLAG
jgi:hypothetical protein